MSQIQQFSNPDIENYIFKYTQLGGVVDFKFFRVSDVSMDEAHCTVARQTIGSLEQPLLIKGVETSSQQFFGPYFNLDKEQPILLGKVGRKFKDITIFSDYFYYDDKEDIANVISIERKGDYKTQGYADAFLEPPHSFGGRMNNLEIGNFFLEFNRFIFDDFNCISIFSWPTDCSSYFDDGKEWWGSFFWTVYNPKKDWYIGITVSTTD